MPYRPALAAVLCLSLLLPAAPGSAMPAATPTGTAATATEAHSPAGNRAGDDHAGGCPHQRGEKAAAPALPDSADTAQEPAACCGHCDCGCLPVQLLAFEAAPAATRPADRPTTAANAGPAARAAHPPLRPPIR